MSFKYQFSNLFNPTLAAIKELGGSARNDEVEEKVIQIMKLSDKEIEDIHRGNITKLNYRLRWARNYLKHAGYIENSSRGVWALTSLGKNTNLPIEESTTVKLAKKNMLELTGEKLGDAESDKTISDEIIDEAWREEVLDILKSIDFEQFERLCQRLLRELGFFDVEVTKRGSDEGIDGKGILKIGSVVSFRIVFQCKRYKDTVSSDKIRDFRGAYQGRADKALLITTARFTRDARIEAQRDGALVIDLIDGEELVEHLKNLNLGLKVSQIEKVEILPGWFNSI